MSKPSAVQVASLVMVLTSCGTTLEETRPDPMVRAWPVTPQYPTKLVISPRPERTPLRISEGEFLDFMRRAISQLPGTDAEVRMLMEQTRQAMFAPPQQRAFQITLAVGEPLTPGMLPMVEQYKSWCRGRGQADDCSGALRGKGTLDEEGRYRIAFDIALRSQWIGFATEMGSIMSFENVKVVLLTAMVIYMLTIAVPELTTKFVAATITMVLTAYLGAQAVWELIGGWLEMVAAARAATTFAQLAAAGNRYGERMGAEVARVLVMVVTAAIAEGGLVARALNLPRAAEAAVALRTDSGGRNWLGGVEQVRGASVAESGVTVVLVPPGSLVQQSAALAMAARGTVSTSSQPGTGCDEKPKWHHIATVENSKSALRGGPWTPRFKELFDRAGLSMENAANKVRVRGHRGPHPEAYHQAVYDELRKALGSCQTPVTCQESLISALHGLAQDIATPRSVLNTLVTRGCEN